MNFLRWVSIVPEINERAPLTLCKLEPTSIIRVSETTTITPVSLASENEGLPNDTVLDREQNRSSVRSWKDGSTAALGLVDCWPFSRLLHASLYDFSSSLAVVCFTRLVFTRLLFPSSLFKVASISGFLKLSGTSCFIFASPSDSLIYAFQSSSSHGSQRTSSLSSSARTFCLITCSSSCLKFLVLYLSSRLNQPIFWPAIYSQKALLKMKSAKKSSAFWDFQ